MIRTNNNFYVITGGPGTGKTTLLQLLADKSYVCVNEVAREIIKQQMKTGGDALPWANNKKYIQLMLSASVNSYINTEMTVQKYDVVFFDRGIPDTICYSDMIGFGISPEMQQAVNNFRYNSTVFLLPPWLEIYQTDAERKQDWEEAVRTYHYMKKTYEQCGYDIIEIPKVSVEERLEFILSSISST